MENKPLVSIVTVCMNRPDNLAPCLRSIAANTSVSYEVFVVAYMFSEENLAAMQEEFPWATFIRSDELRGFSENNNLALKRAQGEFCFILNDDTEFSSPLIDTLVADFRSLPADAAIVSPRILNADGSLQLCGRPLYPAYRYALQQWHLYREPADNVSGKVPVFGRVFRTFNITGACFLIKTDVFRSLGWFDETYYFTPEDLALSTLAREKGYGVYVDGGICVTHKWRTTASRISPAVRPASVKGSLIFFGRKSPAARFLLSLAVWCAEETKYLKACIRCLVKPSEEAGLSRRTYRNIRAEIFSPLTPKEIFVKYY